MMVVRLAAAGAWPGALASLYLLPVGIASTQILSGKAVCLLLTSSYHRPPSLPPPNSFHPDKSERMRGIIAYYIKGEEHALDRFPGGSEPGTRR